MTTKNTSSMFGSRDVLCSDLTLADFVSTLPLGTPPQTAANSCVGRQLEQGSGLRMPVGWVEIT